MTRKVKSDLPPTDNRVREERAGKPDNKGVKRSVLVGFGVQAMLLGLGGWLIFSFVPKVLERAAVTELARLGVPSVELRVVAIETEQLVVEAIQIGAEGDLELSRLRILFDWHDLITGRIDEVTLDGLRFRLRHEGDRITFGALDPLFRVMQDGAAEDVEYAPERWPVDKVILRNARLDFQLPIGPMRIGLEGVLRQEDDLAVSLTELRFRTETEAVRLSGHADGQLDPDGSIAFDMAIGDGALTFGGMHLAFDAGTLRLQSNLDRPEQTDATAKVALRRATLPLGLSAEGTLTARVDASGAVVSLNVMERELGAEGTVNLTFMDLFSPQRSVAFDAGLEVADVATLRRLIPALPLTSGSGEIGLSMKASLTRVARAGERSLAAGRAIDVPPVSISVSLREVGLQGFAAPVDVTGRLQAILAGRGVRIIPIEPLVLSAKGAVAVLPGIIKEFVPGTTHSITLATEPTDFVSLATEGDAALARLRLGYAITSNEERLAFGEVHVEGRHTLTRQRDGVRPEELGAPEVHIERATLSVPRRQFSGKLTANSEITLSGRIVGNVFDGALDIDVGAEGMARSFGVPIGAGRVSAAFLVRADRAGVILNADECIDVIGRGVRAPPPIRVMDTLRLCLGLERLEIGLSDDASVETLKINGYLTSREPSRNFSIDAGGKAAAIVQTGGARLLVDGRMALGGDGPAIDGDVRLNGARIVFPGAKVALDDVSVSSTWRDAAPSWPTRVSVAAARIQHGATEPFFAPMSLAGHAVRDGDRVNLEGSLENSGLGFVVEARGEHLVTSGQGRISLRTTPIIVDPDRRPLSALSPFTARYVRETGLVALLVGDLDWDLPAERYRGGGELLIQEPRMSRFERRTTGLPRNAVFEAGRIALKIESEGSLNDPLVLGGRVLLEGAGFSVGGAKVYGVNGVIPFTDLVDLSGDEAVNIAVAGVEVGLPLTDGIVSIELPGDGTLPRLLGADFAFAGGVVTLSDLSVPERQGDPLGGALQIRGVPIETLFARFGLDGIESDGVLDGGITFEKTGDRFRIADGGFSARGTGQISYAPNSPLAGDLEMLGEVLRNFQYTDLTLNLEERTEGIGALLRIKGKNPDYLGGVPVDLQVNVTGDLMGLARDSLGAYTIPEEIGRRMRGFSE